MFDVIEKILDRLDNVKRNGKGFIAKCPAHDDKSPSLSLTELPDGRILMKCFAGCQTLDVLWAIGLEMVDLFPEGNLGYYKGFQRVEEEYKAKQDDKNITQKVILELCKERRNNGERLSTKEMELEKKAFMQTRKITNAIA